MNPLVVVCLVIAGFLVIWYLISWLNAVRASANAKTIAENRNVEAQNITESLVAIAKRKNTELHRQADASDARAREATGEVARSLGRDVPTHLKIEEQIAIIEAEANAEAMLDYARMLIGIEEKRLFAFNEADGGMYGRAREEYLRHIWDDPDALLQYITDEQEHHKRVIGGLREKSNRQLSNR